MPMWFIVENPTPLLNTKHFHLFLGGKTGSEVDLSCLELVALPGMVLFLIEREGFIGTVQLQSYNQSPLYVDLRFGSISPHHPFLSCQRPQRDEILESMEKRIGARYIWGGNWGDGIPELLSLYPPKSPLEDTIKSLWTLQGVDCSGLLFEAAKGQTPRNTSDLCVFGAPVLCEGLSIDRILSILEPLDMIVYPGHVIFVRDSDTVIESRSLYGGVKTTSTYDRLQELLFTRIPIDSWDKKKDPSSFFMIRRMP